MGPERKWSKGGEARAYSQAFSFFHGRKHRPRRSLRALSWPSWRRDGVGEVKLFLTPSSVHPNSEDFFSSSGVLELLCWPQTSTKALLSMSDYLNWCLYGEDGIEFLLWHFANVTPQWYFALITFSNCLLNHKVYNYKWSL